MLARRLSLALAFAAAAALKLAPLVDGAAPLAAAAARPGSAGLGFFRSTNAVLAAAAVEAVLALLLLIPGIWRAGAWCSAAASTSFWIYVLALTWTGEDVKKCGCFGRVELPLLTHASLLLSLLLLSLSCVWTPPRCHAGTR